MQRTGDSDIFRKFRISNQGGILWKDCVLSMPFGHVVATFDDLIVHQGSASTYKSVLEGSHRKYFNSQRNDDFYKNSFLVVNPPDKEVWYCIPQVGQENATLALIWNWVSGKVGYRDLNNVPFADSGPLEVDPDI